MRSGSSQTLPPPVDLPILRPSLSVSSGAVSACPALAVHLAHQVQAGGDVAPLVGPADLQRAVVPAGQLEEVHRLQQHVAELGEADPAGTDAGAHRFLAEHGADRKVLADVTQEVEDGQSARPVQVVDELGAAGPEVEKALQLLGLPLDALGYQLGCGELALARPPARVTDQPGSAADQRERPVSGLLEAAQQHHRNQVADVQRVCGRDRTRHRT